jgi:hypothetical protein
MKRRGAQMANQMVSVDRSHGLTGLSGQIKAQLAQTRRTLLGAGLIAILVIGGVIAIRLRNNVSFELLTRDIFAITGYPVYFGILSNIGIVGWTISATLWLITAWFIRRHEPDHSLFQLTVASGIFSLVLLVDDALMLHEVFLPEKLGVSEEVIMVGYGLVALLYLFVSIRSVRGTPYLAWLIAGCLLGGSFMVDFAAMTGDLEYLVEDGLKFAGIVFWATYAALTALQIIEERLRQPAELPARPEEQLLSREVGA